MLLLNNGCDILLLSAVFIYLSVPIIFCSSSFRALQERHSVEQSGDLWRNVVVVVCWPFASVSIPLMKYMHL